MGEGEGMGMGVGEGVYVVGSGVLLHLDSFTTAVGKAPGSVCVWVSARVLDVIEREHASFHW